MSKLRMVVGGGGSPATTSRGFIEAGLHLTGMDKPRILLIPTAKYTENAYNKAVGSFLNAYAQDAGLSVKVLHDFGVTPTSVQMIDALSEADMLYMTGGNIRYMLEQLSASAEPLIDHVRSGAVVATGMCGGMMAWFQAGLSDWPSQEVSPETPWDYVDIECFNLLRGTYVTPQLDAIHPQTNAWRADAFINALRHQPTGTIGIGLAHNTALEIVDGNVTILSNNESHDADVQLTTVLQGGELSHNYYTNGRFPLSMFIG